MAVGTTRSTLSCFLERVPGADDNAEPFGGERLPVESNVDCEDRAFGKCETKPGASAQVKAVQGEALILVAHLAHVDKEVPADQ